MLDIIAAQHCCVSLVTNVALRYSGNGNRGSLAHLSAAAASFRPLLRAARFRGVFGPVHPKLFVHGLPCLRVFPIEQLLLWDLARRQELPNCCFFCLFEKYID